MKYYLVWLQREATNYHGRINPFIVVCIAVTHLCFAYVLGLSAWAVIFR